MAFERKWAAISARQFTLDGTTSGVVTLASTSGFKVKQQVVLQSNTQGAATFEVKRVLSKITMLVGPSGTSITTYSNISAYLVSDNASISAPEQPRTSIPDKEYERASYEEEPTVAKRTFLVDEFGNKYSLDNPFPVELSDGSINIGTVNAELEVQLSAKDNVPHAGDVHDSVRIGDGKNELKLNPDGSIRNAEVIFPLLANANWMKLGNFDKIDTSVVGNVTTLDYYEDSALIGKAELTFSDNSGWNIQLTRYINDDDGSFLLDDDGTELNLD